MLKYVVFRFQAPTSLSSPPTMLVGMSGSIFDDKSPLLQTPPESCLLVPNMERTAAEQDYRRQKSVISNRQRGSSLSDLSATLESERVDDMTPRLSSSLKSRLSFSGSYSVLLRGVDALDFRSFTPDAETQHRQSRVSSREGGHAAIPRPLLVPVSPQRPQMNISHKDTSTLVNLHDDSALNVTVPVQRYETLLQDEQLRPRMQPKKRNSKEFL